MIEVDDANFLVQQNFFAGIKNEKPESKTLRNPPWSDMLPKDRLSWSNW